MHKYNDGVTNVVRFQGGGRRQEACGRTMADAERMAARMARNEVLYLVGRSVACSSPLRS